MGESYEKAVHRTSFVERLATLSKIFKMRLLIQAYFLAVFFVLSVDGDKSSKSCAKPYDKMMVCNLMCNLLQDSGANDAIKILQTKVESLIAVVNKPSPALPPGKLTSMMPFWILHLENLLGKRERQQRRKSIINIACVRAAAITITSFAFCMSFLDLCRRKRVIASNLIHLSVSKFTSNQSFSCLQPFLPLHARNSLKNTGEFPGASW